MADFSTNILEFQQNGTYTYKFDSVGNLYFNSSSADFSQVYLKLPLTNVVYDNSKIEKFYDPEFREFIVDTKPIITETTTNELQNQIDAIQNENNSLKITLDSLISKDESNSSSADKQATRQVILELRKTLGQGRVDSDFSDTFPYTKIIKPLSQA